MAQGGDAFGLKDPYLDASLDEKDDGDDEEEVNRTRPFQPDEPGAASTPYPSGETIEMQTMLHERSGLPDTSYSDETPLLSDFLTPEDQESFLEREKQKIVDRFPKADFKKLPPIGFSKEGDRSEIVAFKAGKEERIFFKKTSPDGESRLLKAFTTKYSKALGPPAEQIIAEDRDTIREQRKRFFEAEKELEQAQTLLQKFKSFVKKFKSFVKKPRVHRPGLMQFKMNRGQILKVKQNCAS